MRISSMEAEKVVVVIQDASREINATTLHFMRWALDGLPLNRGDKPILLVLLHEVNTPSNQKIIRAEVTRIKKEYKNHAELIHISKLYRERKVKIRMRLAKGPSLKVVATEAAKNLKATMVILDRKMKRDKNYMLDNLPCGISMIKKNNIIEQLRRSVEIDKFSTQKWSQQSIRLSYNEMIPGSPDEDDLFSIELFPMSKN
ncbi:hypothetical protein FEM48_Zijuj02G0017700 [Ziziphus jujuba var. spinosa]|uniref:Uncharacterized protein n=1 Tax=Ziziphus jujuba var. spinosa TaxID=714518 RepID=A0A978VSW7_ZIZJJ|nr:hypothetical protein FEM48_Zijuj02G0017700 [Ziziphus jujuba var. spinosa]